jgi:hypothetical protein
MDNPPQFRRSAAREIARAAGLLERLRAYRHDLTLAVNRLHDVAEQMPDSHALAWALGDLRNVIDHLNHAISALEADSRQS